MAIALICASVALPPAIAIAPPAAPEQHERDGQCLGTAESAPSFRRRQVRELAAPQMRPRPWLGRLGEARQSERACAIDDTTSRPHPSVSEGKQLKHRLAGTR